jgi:hypothetical protein
VKYSKKVIHSRVSKVPAIKFEDQRLTSFAGLVIFQPLFSKLDIKERLRGCFSHRKVSAIFGPHLIVLCLVVHLLIGYRKLRDMDYYREDPIVKRLVGLNRMPDVATVSRALAGMDEVSVWKLRRMIREMVIHRLHLIGRPRVRWISMGR